jgi:hypothetical protein
MGSLWLRVSMNVEFVGSFSEENDVGRLRVSLLISIRCFQPGLSGTVERILAMLLPLLVWMVNCQNPFPHPKHASWGKISTKKFWYPDSNLVSDSLVSEMALFHGFSLYIWQYISSIGIYNYHMAISTIIYSI